MTKAEVQPTIDTPTAETQAGRSIDVCDPNRSDAGETCVLEPLEQAIAEAHDFWHDCRRTYFEPVAFRRYVNALLQAARNVTFRLQALKGEIPGFDEWYCVWQAFMRSRPTLAWVVGARNRVVKEKGLDSVSVAQARLIHWYDAPFERRFTFSPSATTEQMVAEVRDSLPGLEAGRLALIIERRWEVDQLAGIELLDTLAECLEIYRGLCQDAHRHLREGGEAWPEGVLAGLEPSECLHDTHGWRTFVIDPSSLTSLVAQQVEVTRDDRIVQEAVKRYRLDVPDTQTEEPDPLAYAEALVPIVRRVLEKDGHHIPLTLLHHPTRGWELRSVSFSDSIGKYVAFHELGLDVRRGGYDGLVLVSECWTAPSTTGNLGLRTLADAKGRGEAVSIAAASADGRVRTWAMPFTRRFGRAKVVEVTTTDDNPPFNILPVLRAWGLISAEAEPHPRKEPVRQREN